MAVKKSIKNNYGKGFQFQFQDGHILWALGMSSNELKNEEVKHGKCISKLPL